MLRSLIIDDEPQSTNLLQKGLMKAGFSPVCVKDVKIAMDMMVSYRPDLVVFDIAMTPRETKELGALQPGDPVPFPVSQLSGLANCRRWRQTYSSDLVLLLASTIEVAESIALTEGIQIPANGFVYKKDSAESIASVVMNAWRNSKVFQIGLYNGVRELLDEPDLWWQGELLRETAEHYFAGGLRGGDARQLWEALADGVGHYNELGELLQSVLRACEITESLTDGWFSPQRHVGDLYWTGYLVLNKLILPTERLAQETPEWLGDDQTPTDHLNMSWLLTCFLWGTSLIPQAASRALQFAAGMDDLLDSSLSDALIHEPAIDDKRFGVIRDFLENQGPGGTKLCNALDLALAKVKDVPQDSLVGGGLSCAHLLLRWLSNRCGHLMSDACILHSASALALRDLNAWNRNSRILPKPVRVGATVLPMFTVLSLSNEILAGRFHEFDTNPNPSGPGDDLRNCSRTRIEKIRIDAHPGADAWQPYGQIRATVSHMPSYGDGMDKISGRLLKASKAWAKSMKLDTHFALENKELPRAELRQLVPDDPVSPQVIEFGAYPDRPRPRQEIVSMGAGVSTRPQDGFADVVVLAALEEEMTAILGHLGGNERNVEGRRFYETVVKGPEASSYRAVVLPLFGPGNTNAAAYTEFAIACWRPRCILLVGIAGGVKKSQERLLGDVLVSDQIVDYELAKVRDAGPEVRYQAYRPAWFLLEQAQRIGLNDWVRRITPERPQATEGRSVPMAHFGVIASGQKVVADSATVPNLQTPWPQLIGVEMEAAGAAHAAYRRDYPGILVVKGISDWADENKNDLWHSYAADAAAAFCAALLRQLSFPET